MPSSAESEGKEGRKTQQNTQLLTLLVLYFRLVGLLLGVWVLGYFGFSASWVMIGLFIYLFNEKFRRKRQLQFEIGRELVKNEKAEILARVEDLPSWVYFPDRERAEWVNKILAQMWPYIGDYVTKILIESVEPKIVESMPSYLKSFKFVKIDLGDLPPRIGGIKCYAGGDVKRDEVYLDLDLIFFSDANIKVAIRGIHAGIKDLQIRGDLRVIFKPLIPVSPLIGGVTVFFLTNPNIDFNLTDLGNALDMPGLSDMLRGIVQDQVANFLVLPNRIAVQLAENVQVARLQYPIPQGVLRIQVVEAKDLKKADMSLIGKGKSDPYMILHVGAQTFKTKVINNTLTPNWNETFEAIVDQRSGQSLEFEVFDEDPGNKDDFLGRSAVDIESVYDKGTLNTWITLEDVSKGMVHLNLTWLHLSSDLAQMDEAMFQMRQQSTTDNPLSSAVLMVYLDSATNLPISRKTKEPTPYAVLSVSNNTKQSNFKPQTPDPRWEENFQFLINDPNIQNLDVEIKDKKTGNKLGNTFIPLKLLLTEPNMTQDQPFVLRESGPNSTVTMRVVLRVLTSTPPITNPEESQPDDLLKPSPVETSTPASTPTKQDALDQDHTDGDVIVMKSNEPMLQSAPPGTEVRKRNLNKSTSDDGGYGLGRIQITLRYSPQRNRLIIVIHKCVNLIPCDDDNVADPYVRIYLLPEKNTLGKKKTHTKKNTLEPSWDETFEFAINQNDLEGCKLDIAVKNSVGVFAKERKEMGQVIIDLGKVNLTHAVTDWYDLHEQNELSEMGKSTESSV